jgi:tetratricopeptide (TPR) repeat protein
MGKADHRCTPLFVCVLLLGGCSHPRELRLDVAADPAFRGDPAWQSEIRSRLANVSKAFESQVGIRLVVAHVGPWATDGAVSGESLPTMLRRVERAPGADVLVGISGRQIAGKPLGETIPFDDLTLIVQSRAVAPERNVAALMHEIAHLFGAWHSQDKQSVMYEIPSTTRLDDTSKRVLRLMRQFDFGKSLAQISPSMEEQIAALLPKQSEPRIRNPIAQAHTGQGIRFHLAHLMSEAIPHYREAVRLDPNDATYHHNLGLAFGDAGQPALAVSEFWEAVRLDPRSALGHETLALTLAKVGLLEQAAAQFREALRYAPGSAGTHFNLGLTLGHMPQRLPEAAGEFREAIRLAPDHRGAHEALQVILEKRPDLR